jgi:hypothetical protein
MKQRAPVLTDRATRRASGAVVALAGALISLAQACAGAPATRRVTGPAAPGFAAAPLHVKDRPDPAAPASPSLALQRLTSAVNTLDDAPPDANHRALVQALRDLGVAIAQLPGTSTARVAAVLDAAQRLESAPAASYLHADLLKKGLAAALGALLARSAPDEGTPYRDGAYRDMLARLGMAIDSIRGDRALLDQGELVADSFRAATDAVYLASSLQPPFPRAAAGVQHATSPALDQELSDARAALLELGQARWPNARAAVARALFSLADVVESLPNGGALSDKVNRIRLQAERLSSADLLTLDQTKWLVTGLLTALEALDLLPAEQGAFVASWREAARNAIAGLSQGDTLAFQAAAVQDGFRTTLDAFVAVSHSNGPCR